jgi:hypothetical protein
VRIGADVLERRQQRRKIAPLPCVMRSRSVARVRISSAIRLLRCAQSSA